MPPQWRFRVSTGRNAWDVVTARVSAIHALHLYLPASIVAARIRRWLRDLRGASSKAPRTLLPSVSWQDVFASRPLCLAETRKCDGNVRVSELAILALAASHAPPAGEIVEIGTFDGRTALNLAINAPRDATVMTLDLPADQATALAIEASERQYVDKPAPGARLRSCAARWREPASRVVQLHGDSATFDWSRHEKRAGLVFVDGSHAYDYAKRDSETAMRLVRPDGMVFWHDYGVWSGVTQALEELENSAHLGLVNIRGTSLVFWHAGQGR
jgi:predicted O-methyltransferase YrrM